MQPRRFCCIIIVFVSLVVDVSRGQQLYEGDECSLGESGLYGQCKKSQDCPGIRTNVAAGQYPRICSFTQKSAIYCCPVTRGQRPNNTERTATPPRYTSTGTPSLGDTCTLRNQARGVCKNIQNCPRIYNGIERGLLPIVCNFHGNVTIVCCPINNPTATYRPPHRTTPNNDYQRRTTDSAVTSRPTTASTSSAVGTKSLEMCDYYSQFVFQLIQAPILLLKPVYFNESLCASREHAPNQAPLRDVEEALYREFPHVVSLGYGNESHIQWLCGGSIISESFILTTAHCITSPNSGKVRWARVGDMSPTVHTTNSAVNHAVAERIPHEGWRESAPSRHDIALLKLEKYVSFLGGDARPACLYTEPGNPPGHKFATVAGWGMTDWHATATTTTMKKKDLTLVPDSQCASVGTQSNRRRHQRRGETESSRICVSDSSPDDSTSSCVGDAGGPLQVEIDTHFCMFAIVGLASFGPRACADGKTPAAYTRVSDYISWIEGHVWGPIEETKRR